MKRLSAMFLVFVLFNVFTSAQTFNLNGVTAEVHAFAGFNIPTQDADKDQFKFDYACAHFDFSNGIIKMQVRPDFLSGNLQLMNVTKTFGFFSITAGRFLDPVFWLYPAPHIMGQIGYPASVCLFGSLDNGVMLSLVDSVWNGNVITVRASVYDSDGSRNFSFSADADLKDIRIGYFLQTRDEGLKFGARVSKSFHKLINLEGGLVTGTVKSAPSAEFYLQNRARVVENLSVWAQGDFQCRIDNFKASRIMAGASYEYSKNSHIKLFYNFTDKVAIGKITFFL